MSTREALRVFQSRLADRLQQARAAGTAASWLAVEAGGLRLLFPLQHAGEIFPWQPLQRVPYTQPWFLGVANLRGGLFGVADIGAFVTGGDVPVRTEVAQLQCRLVALNPLLELNCALVVDRLLGLRNVDAFVASAEPPAGSPPYFGHTYTDAQGGTWQELNLQTLSLQPQFLGVSA